ncbi:AcrB/AcrD/AcrF family protein, partial [Klebsiella pneumoniae]
RKEIEHFVDYVGTGAPRFYLPLDQQLQQPNFAQFVITAKNVEERDALSRWLSATLEKDFSGVRTRVAQLENGPPVGFPIKFRVSGDNSATVRNIADQVAEQVRADAR